MGTWKTEALEPVVEDLLRALNDEDLCDVALVGSDGILVPANRFVLAARCPVLKRMLYGNFREAKSANICLESYGSDVLRALTEFCMTGNIEPFKTRHVTPTEASIRQLVQLVHAADYFELPLLQRLVHDVVKRIMIENPPLACVVWDATTLQELASSALQIIECRPYIALDLKTALEEARGGGIECLGENRLVELFSNSSVAAGELFLYEMLQRWFQNSVRTGSRKDALTIAQRCSTFIRFEDIDPKELLSADMQSCPLVPRDRMFAAFATQALRASRDKVWKIHCRGPQQSEERVLVEGAGARDANGIYYRISGLSNGDLYTKQEISCGQQIVYTLSRSVDKEIGAVKCRIFCSQLLTHNAVLQLQHMSSTSNSLALDPTFQPVLQVHSLSSKPAPRSPASVMSFSSDEFYQLTLSDGKWYMPGTLSQSLEKYVSSKKIIENSIIKVTGFGLYEDEGCCCIHITKLSIVTSSPGQTFGSPRAFLSLSVELDQSDLSTLMFDSLNEKDSVNGSKIMYKCTAREGDSKIPSTRWESAEHGLEPSPQCCWIAANK